MSFCCPFRRCLSAAEADSAVPIASVADYIGGSSDVVCFGHSLGGTLALAAELRRPGTFAAIFLYEPVIASG